LRGIVAEPVVDLHWQHAMGGRLGQAETDLRAVVRRNAALGARPYVVLARLDLASVLQRNAIAAGGCGTPAARASALVDAGRLNARRVIAVSAGGRPILVGMASEVLVEPVIPWRGMTRAQYDALVDTGLLEGEPVELLEGVLVEVSPQGEPHADAIMLLTRWLVPRLPEPWLLRVQLPLAATDRSEPEPDLAVAQRIIGQHPTTAALAIEIAVSSHRTDLLVKARVYAAAAVMEYWVIDVPAREVVVHTEPGRSGYALVRRLPWTAPLSVPLGEGIPIDLAAVLAPA